MGRKQLGQVALLACSWAGRHTAPHLQQARVEAIVVHLQVGKRVAAARSRCARTGNAALLRKEAVLPSLNTCLAQLAASPG